MEFGKNLIYWQCSYKLNATENDIYAQNSENVENKL